MISRTSRGTTVGSGSHVITSARDFLMLAIACPGCIQQTAASVFIQTLENTQIHTLTEKSHILCVSHYSVSQPCVPLLLALNLCDTLMASSTLERGSSPPPSPHSNPTTPHQPETSTSPADAIRRLLSKIQPSNLGGTAKLLYENPNDVETILAAQLAEVDKMEKNRLRSDDIAFSQLEAKKKEIHGYDAESESGRFDEPRNFPNPS